jgi:hypothetical protein
MAEKSAVLLVLRPRRRLEQQGGLFDAEYRRQPTRFAHQREASCKVRPVERHGEEETQSRNGTIDARRAYAGLRLMALETAQSSAVAVSGDRDYFLTNPIRSSITTKGPTGTFLGLAVIARNINLSSMILRMRSLNTSTVKSSPAQRR